MFDDTADMLTWVLRLENQGETVAEFIDKQARAEVEARYAPLADRVARIKAAEAGDPEPAFANDLEGEAP